MTHSPCPNQRPPRIALYSHDTMGLGHKRRNWLIAQTLGTAAWKANILMISGMRDASDGPTPAGVDCLTLPALYKTADGRYQPRQLMLELEELIGLRSQLIRTAIKNFKPDVLIVDNVPRGAMRELDPTLEYIKSQLPTRCILGLRDVIDTPNAVRRDWKRAENLSAIRRYYYALWIYGDPQVYDLRREYPLPADVVAKMQPLGYLDQRDRLHHVRPSTRLSLAALDLPQERLVLGLVGGGQDGAALARAFAQVSFPADTTGVLVTGPFMPPDLQAQIQAQGAQNPQLRVVDYVEEPALLFPMADRVVAMGGYNTTCEILSFQKKALLVPRVKPRQEQWIRAQRLAARGLIDVLHPQQLTPAAISDWLHQPCYPSSANIDLNLNGLDNLRVALQALLQTMPFTAPHAS
ncbi:glycosyltransferase [filamentous cyanobacterium CCP5]|nr:glycosyltransferase [filamentous cyanobacterium CCP5]